MLHEQAFGVFNLPLPIIDGSEGDVRKTALDRREIVGGHFSLPFAGRIQRQRRGVRMARKTCPDQGRK